MIVTWNAIKVIWHHCNDAYSQKYRKGSHGMFTIHEVASAEKKYHPEIISVQT